MARLTAARLGRSGLGRHLGDRLDRYRNGQGHGGAGVRYVSGCTDARTDKCQVGQMQRQLPEWTKVMLGRCRVAGARCPGVKLIVCHGGDWIGF
jgi:hypothetical protein